MYQGMNIASGESYRCSNQMLKTIIIRQGFKQQYIHMIKSSSPSHKRGSAQG